MAERLDKHDTIHHALFDEDTNQVGSLGDIVEKHAGDAVFLAPPEKSAGGADGGESDFEAEMLETDPAPGEGMNPDDLYSEGDERGVFSADATGTVAGIARGFGTHLPQDIGQDGFQVEAIPDSALRMSPRPLADGEELDDYDDDTDEGKDDAKGKLAADSEPFSHMVSEPGGDGTAMGGQIPVKQRLPSSTDDELDATGAMK